MTGAARQALAAYDLQVRRLRPLAASFNRLYRVRAVEGTFVLRLGPGRRVHLDEVAAAEREWTTLLGGIAPQVRPTRAGAASVTVDDAREGASRECMVLTWTPGRPLSRPVGADDVRGLADLAAQLHTAPEPAGERPAGVLDAGQALLFPVPDVLPGRFAGARQRAQAAIDGLAGPRRRLHGDLTPNNVVRARTGLRALDFQDLMWGDVVQDLAHTVHGLRNDDPDGSLASTFLERYAERAPLPDLSALPHLMMARRLSTANLGMVLGRSVADTLARHADAVLEYERTAG